MWPASQYSYGKWRRSPPLKPGDGAAGPQPLHRGAPAPHLCGKQGTAAVRCCIVWGAAPGPACRQSLRAGGRKAYFSVSDSCKTCCSSASSSRSRSSCSSSSLAESSMASCRSLSKLLVSREAPGHRPSEPVGRLSWTALRENDTGQRNSVLTSSSWQQQPYFLTADPVCAEPGASYTLLYTMPSIPRNSGGVGAGCRYIPARDHPATKWWG